jgi:hypothetical protein
MEMVDADMFTLNDYLVMRLSKHIMQERLKEAEAYHLLKMCEREDSGWFTYPICRLIFYLGRLMRIWGERLQRYSLAVGGHEE